MCVCTGEDQHKVSVSQQSECVSAGQDGLKEAGFKAKLQEVTETVENHVLDCTNVTQLQNFTN